MLSRHELDNKPDREKKQVVLEPASPNPPIPDRPLIPARRGVGDVQKTLDKGLVTSGDLRHAPSKPYRKNKVF